MAREIFETTVNGETVRVWKQENNYVNYDKPSVIYKANEIGKLKSLGTTADIK